MNRLLSIIGIVGTLAWLGAIAWIFGARFGELSQLDPNEIGDFLAGTLGPLGILWLILGFFQQGMELRDTTRSLDLQSKALQISVQEQRELLVATRSHVEADRAAVALAREQQQQLLRPRFAFLDIVTLTGESGPVMHFELRNLGANASEVRMEAKPALQAPMPSRLPVALTGPPYPCTLHWAPGHPAAGDHLIVSFRDLVGHPGSMRYEFVFDDAGKLVEIVPTGD